MVKFVNPPQPTTKQAQICPGPNPALYNALVATLSLKDPGLAEHSNRCAQHVWILMEALERESHLAATLYDPGHVCQAIRLHDLGKIAIPDAILRKPGPLTSEETKIMQTHCVAGARALRGIQCDNQLECEPVLSLAIDVALYHHERWNGEGYPHGVKGDAIPVIGRIATLIDVYDSLCSARVYKPAFSHGQALEIMSEMAAITFDPELYEIFAGTSHSIQASHNKFAKLFK